MKKQFKHFLKLVKENNPAPLEMPIPKEGNMPNEAETLEPKAVYDMWYDLVKNGWLPNIAAEKTAKQFETTKQIVLKLVDAYQESELKERWDPSMSNLGHEPWNEPQGFIEDHTKLIDHISEVLNITPEMWEALQDKDNFKTYYALENELENKFSQLYSDDYVIGWDTDLDIEKTNTAYVELAKEIESKIKELEHKQKSETFQFELMKKIFENHFDEIKAIFTKYFTLSESIFKIQKPGDESFVGVIDGIGDCTKCGAEKVPVENHVCTTKIEEASEASIKRKVDEVNGLIASAIDSDGDPIGVIDTSGTWEEKMYYKPIVYSNGGLIITYEDQAGKPHKERINKKDMEMDGIPTLNNIAKMYRKYIKKEKNKADVSESVNVSDDLKSNFRSWEYDHDNEKDAEGLFAILKDRHPNESDEKLKQMAYNWVGYEEKIDEKLSQDAKDFISKKIAYLMDKEGMPQKQAIAVAYSYAKEEGYDVPKRKKKNKKAKNEIMVTSLKQFKLIKENADAAQQELDAVQRWVEKSDLPFDDWEWDGEELKIFVGKNEPEKYSRQDLKEAGVQLFDVNPLNQ